MKISQAVSVIIIWHAEIGAGSINCTYRSPHHFCCLCSLLFPVLNMIAISVFRFTQANLYWLHWLPAVLLVIMCNLINNISPLFFCGNVVTESAKCSYSHLADEELLAHPPLSCRILLATVITKFSFRCSFTRFEVPLSCKVSFKIFHSMLCFYKGIKCISELWKNPNIYIMKEDLKLAWQIYLWFA